MQCLQTSSLDYIKIPNTFEIYSSDVDYASSIYTFKKKKAKKAKKKRQEAQTVY